MAIDQQRPRTPVPGPGEMKPEPPERGDGAGPAGGKDTPNGQPFGPGGPAEMEKDGSGRLTPHDYELANNLQPRASETPRPWRAVANHALSPDGRPVDESKIVGTNSTDIPALWTTTYLLKSPT